MELNRGSCFYHQEVVEGTVSSVGMRGSSQPRGPGGGGDGSRTRTTEEGMSWKSGAGADRRGEESLFQAVHPTVQIPVGQSCTGASVHRP